MRLKTSFGCDRKDRQYVEGRGVCLARIGYLLRDAAGKVCVCRLLPCQDVV